MRLISGKVDSWLDGFFRLLPNIVAGLVFFGVAYLVARLISGSVRRLAIRRNRPDLGALLGSLAAGSLLITAFLISAAIIFPSVNPSDILATLGIGSVAIGFAFKDILQNLFAGLLLLIRRPFKRGDQIIVKDYEGTIEHIESRATLIKTYDGKRVIIPNADLYISPVEVNTAFPTRRDQYDIGIGYGDDLDEAVRTFTDAVKGLEGIEHEPGVEVLPWELADSYVVLRVRWWVASQRASVVRVKARVIRALWLAAREHGIDLPFPTQVMLFHDQTEAVDGDRRNQREGWPAGRNPPEPRRIRLVSAEDADASDDPKR